MRPRMYLKIGDKVRHVRYSVGGEVVEESTPLWKEDSASSESYLMME